MGHLKRSSITGHLLRNAAGHLVNECAPAVPAVIGAEIIIGGIYIFEYSHMQSTDVAYYNILAVCAYGEVLSIEDFIACNWPPYCYPDDCSFFASSNSDNFPSHATYTRSTGIINIYSAVVQWSKRTVHSDFSISGDSSGSWQLTCSGIWTFSHRRPTGFSTVDRRWDEDCNVISVSSLTSKSGYVYWEF